MNVCDKESVIFRQQPIKIEPLMLADILLRICKASANANSHIKILRKAVEYASVGIFKNSFQYTTCNGKEKTFSEIILVKIMFLAKHHDFLECFKILFYAKNIFFF